MVLVVLALVLVVLALVLVVSMLIVARAASICTFILYRKLNDYNILNLYSGITLKINFPTNFESLILVPCGALIPFDPPFDLPV